MHMACVQLICHTKQHQACSYILGLHIILCDHSLIITNAHRHSDSGRHRLLEMLEEVKAIDVRLFHKWSTKVLA